MATKHNATDSNKSGSPRDEANKTRFIDQSGLEASQLPDKGRPTGNNDTPVDIGRRNLPQQHGGQMNDDGTYDEGGLRGSRDLGDAKVNGHGGGRGKN